MAQFIFNNNTLVTGISPFFANYRRHLNFKKEPIGIRPTAERAKLKTGELHKLHSLLKKKLNEILKRTIRSANKKRSKGLDF